MTLLRMIPFKLFTRLTDLLNHEVFRAPLNDALDGSAFVSGDDNEAESLLDDSLVLARRDRKLLDTGSVDALTMKRQRPYDAVLLRPFVDPLVDPPEDLFVSRSSLCELHPTMIARLRVDRPFNESSYTGAAKGTSKSSEEGARVTKADDLRREIEEAIDRAAAGKRRKLDNSVKPTPAQPPKRVDGNERDSSD